MKRPDRPPENPPPTTDASQGTWDLARGYNRRYLHWSDLEYRDTGPDSREALWAAMTSMRRGTETTITIGDLVLRLNTTPDMLMTLDRLDAFPSASGDRVPDPLPDAVMREAVASSAMEGATTPVGKALRMLRDGRDPTDRSESMIKGDHEAMLLAIGRSGEGMTPDLLRDIHAAVTRGNLDDPSYCGRFRDDDSIAVRDVLTGETHHVPPSHMRIDGFVGALCRFADGDGPRIHPVVRAVVAHYALAWIHPFTDGTGRTSRCLFHRCMLHHGLPGVLHLSLSEVLRDHRGRYDRAFQLTETDGGDVTYFVDMNLRALSEAVDRSLSRVDRTPMRLR